MDNRDLFDIIQPGDTIKIKGKEEFYQVEGFYDNKYGAVLIHDDTRQEVHRELINQKFELVEKLDNVNHPKHYTSHPSGIECIEITRHYCFTIGNAIKYLWRAGLKVDASLTDREKEIEDLEKAIWYIKDRINQLKNDKK